MQDTQNQPDTRGLCIDRVGVKNVRFPIQVQDRDARAQNTVAMVSLAVNLPKELKGTHMSRFVQVLHEQGHQLHVGNVAAIPAELLQRLQATQAHVEFRFPFFRTKKAPVTGAEGLLDYGVIFDVDATVEKVEFTLTVEVPVATLCPCSKAISERGAHNQRGLVTLSIRSQENVWIEDLLDLVEASASCALYSVLKRPDEKAVTETAYDNPVFVEDVVRNVAARARADQRIAWFRVEAENFESIHNHNAWAVIDSSSLD